MSYSPYSNYGHVNANYGNYDGAYHSSDSAYHLETDYNDYLGDNYQDIPPYPEPHNERHEELTRRAAEYGLTPRRLQELDDECIREQEELAREERRDEEARVELREKWIREHEEEMQMEMEMEQPGEWLEEHEIEVHRGMPTPLTHLEPEGEVYEGYGMADEPPNAATSHEHDTWLNANAVPLECEHQLWEHGTRSPSWEHTTTTNPEYDNEANVHGLVHAGYHAVEPHVDDTMPLEHEHLTLWQEMSAVDEEWAAGIMGEPYLYEEMHTGMYASTTYSPLPSPTPWYPPQPPNSSYKPKPNHFRHPHPHFSYQQ
jgi:hypothetical protein